MPQRLWRVFPVRSSDGPSPYGLWLIGLYKLVKAVVMLAAGGFIVQLDAREVAEGIPRIAGRFGIDPEARFVRRTTERLSVLTTRRLEAVGVGVIAYGLLYGAEGVGLLMERRWGEYLAILNAGVLIPFETFKLFHPRHRWAAASALAINLLILAYVSGRLRREWRQARRTAESAPSRPP